MNIGPTELAANKNITQRVVVCSEAAKQGGQEVALDGLQEEQGEDRRDVQAGDGRDDPLQG